MSKTLLYELLARYRVKGESELEPRSKRPHHSPSRVAHRFEDEIVAIEAKRAAADPMSQNPRTWRRRASPRSLWAGNYQVSTAPGLDLIPQRRKHLRVLFQTLV